MEKDKNTEIRERIIEVAFALFYKTGIRPVSMDDIANGLGMSKRTLYQHFSDKDELVSTLMDRELTVSQQQCMASQAKANDAIEEVFNIMQSVGERLATMNPVTLFDLSKFHRRAFDKFVTYKNEFILRMVKANLLRGIDEGLYRPDIDIEILSRYRLESIFMIFNTDFLPRGSVLRPYELIRILSEHFVYGIVSPKGYKRIEKLKKQTNNK